MRDMIVCCASKHAHNHISKRSMRKRQGETFILILKYDLQLLYPLYYTTSTAVCILSGLYTVIIIGQEEATTTSDPSTATLLYPATGQSSASRICRVRANSHLGSRASGMQGSLDTGTRMAAYYRPESRTLGTLEMSSRTR